MARCELWDKAEWVRKPRPCDDGTANGVNAALAMRSYRFVHTACAFMQRSCSRGYAGGFACVAFDHDQAYRQVWRTRRFRCLVPVVAPPGGGYVDVDGVSVFVAAGTSSSWRCTGCSSARLGQWPATVASPGC